MVNTEHCYHFRIATSKRKITNFQSINLNHYILDNGENTSFYSSGMYILFPVFKKRMECSLFRKPQKGKTLDNDLKYKNSKIAICTCFNFCVSRIYEIMHKANF